MEKYNRFSLAKISSSLSGRGETLHCYMLHVTLRLIWKVSGSFHSHR